MRARAALVVNEIKRLLELQSQTTCDGRLPLRELDISTWQQYQVREIRIAFLFAELEEQNEG
jgi:hypothetical protein